MEIRFFGNQVFWKSDFLEIRFFDGKSHTMKIISFLNMKGGVGKSTLASNLSVYFKRKSFRVLAIDTEPNQVGTLSRWKGVDEDNVLPTVFSVHGSKDLERIKEVSDSFDIVLIDGAANALEVDRAACSISDLVIIPIHHSNADFWGSQATVEVVKSVQIARGGSPLCFFIINRQVPNSRLSKSIGPALAHYSITALKTRISQSVNYMDALGQGSSIADYASSKKNLNELNNLGLEILSILGLTYGKGEKRHDKHKLKLPIDPKHIGSNNSQR